MRTVKLFTIIILFLKIKSSINENSEDEKFDDDDFEINFRIINGENATQVYPFMVSIQIMARHVCGGSIISPFWILTAAHCLYYRPGSLFPAKFCKIHRGALILNSSDVDYRNCDLLKPHYRYQHGTTRDIGLIKVVEPYNETNFQVALVTQHEAARTISSNKQTICTIMGWGTTSPGSNFSKILMTADVVILSGMKCRYKAVDVSPFENFCVARNKGDSGGPLICKGQLYGIASWVVNKNGKESCSGDYPSVYTRVDYYSDWIQSTMNTANQLVPNVSFILIYVIFIPLYI